MPSTPEAGAGFAAIAAGTVEDAGGAGGVLGAEQPAVRASATNESQRGAGFLMREDSFRFPAARKQLLVGAIA